MQLSHRIDITPLFTSCRWTKNIHYRNTHPLQDRLSQVIITFSLLFRGQRRINSFDSFTVWCFIFCLCNKEATILSSLWYFFNVLHDCGGHWYCLSLPGWYHTGLNWPSEGGPSCKGSRGLQWWESPEEQPMLQKLWTGHFQFGCWNLGEKPLHNELLCNFRCIFPGFRSQQPSNAGKISCPNLE